MLIIIGGIGFVTWKLEDEKDPVAYIQTHVGIGYRMLKVDGKCSE